MGWQVPGLASKLKHEVMSLANMGPGEFIFFAVYALAGLVLPLSSFFLTLLEYYGLQLQHLSPNSITLVAIFVHFCEMFVGVRPLVWLFRRFFEMKVVSRHPRSSTATNSSAEHRTMPGTSRPFPLVGGSAGGTTRRWCRWTSTTGSHFLSLHRPSTAPNG
jgi:hypothetical protein